MDTLLLINEVRARHGMCNKVPSSSGRLVHVPEHFLMGYNVTHSIAVLREKHGRCITCIDHSCRPARQWQIDVNTSYHSINTDRLLAGVCGGRRLIKIYDLFSGKCVSDMEVPVRVDNASGLYPISVDTVAIDHCPPVVVKCGHVVSCIGSSLSDITSRYDRAIACGFVRGLRPYTYINTQGNRVCTIYNARDVVLLPDGVAVCNVTGNNWSLIPNSQLETDDIGGVALSPLCESNVLVQQAPTI